MRRRVLAVGRRGRRPPNRGRSSTIDADAIFFLAGLAAPILLVLAVPRLWKHVLAGCFLFLYLLLGFAGFPPLLALLLIGLLPALIANARKQSFLIWWAYGAALPIIAIPHALLLKNPVDAPPPRETYS